MRTPAFCLALLLMASAPAWSQRAPVWETGIQARDVTLSSAATKGKLVFVSGAELIDAGQGIERGIIAAHNAKTGDLVWVEEGDPATGTIGGARWESNLGPLVLAKKVIVAAGWREVSGPGLEGAVRAYDQKTGTLLWNQQIPDGAFTQVAVKGKIVYAATTLGYYSSDPAILLAAYDLYTGTLLWDTVHGPLPEDPKVEALVVSGKHVAVVGWQVDAGAADNDVLVRVHDAKTGTFLWDDVFDAAEGNDFAFTAAVRGKRLFVGGAQTPMGGDRDGLVRAYDLKKGTVLWSHSAAQGGDQIVQALVANGGAVTSLTYRSSPTEGWLLRTHNAKNGIVSWDTSIDVSVTFITSSFAAKGRRVVVGIDSGTHAFDGKTGAPVWDATSAGFSAAIGGKLAFVPGYNGTAAYLVK